MAQRRILVNGVKNIVKLVHTESHSPTQNALIENFNGQLRRLMRSNFIRINDLNWIDHLDMMIETYNKTKHNGTGFRPIDVWTNDRARVAMANVGANDLLLTNDQKKTQILMNTNSRIQAQSAQLQQEHFEVGDRVRVATSALHSEIRKKNKAGDSKLVVMKFSANVFTVGRVAKSRKHREVAVDRYELLNANGDFVLEEEKINNPNVHRPPKRFNICDLQRVPDGTVVTRNKHIESKLNRIGYDARYDVVD